MAVKYLYCPKCKELRVKPWYSMRERCTRCRGDVRPIDVPRTLMTYVIYAIMGVTFILIYLHTRSDHSNFLYAAIVLVGVLMYMQLKELFRGERYARAKIKVTVSDTDAMRRKGWR